MPLADGPRRAARERFLGGAGLDPSVRPEISASWRRSQLNGVAPDRLPELHVGELDVDSRLLRAAVPVLDRMADDIVDVSMSLLLTDGDARILDRRVGVHGLQSTLDDVNAVPGAAYTEGAVGTNGVGSCIETRQPFIVAGGEHFAEPLCRLTCAAAPILHPFSGRLEGVLDVTCAADDTSGLMLAFVREAAEEIRRRLEELAAVTERALFDTFLAAARRSSRPLLSVNGDLVIANAAAARLLEPADHLGVWEQVGGPGGARRVEQIALVSGATFHADIDPIAVGDRAVGALVRLDDRPARGRRPPAPVGVLPGLVGTSASWRAVCRDAALAARSHLDAVVTGEVGTGKLAVARAIHALAAPGAPFEVLDAATAGAGRWDWLDRLRERAARPGTVVVRHLDLVPDEQVSVVAAICDAATARVLATSDGGWPAVAPRRLVDHFPARVAVPPLGDRLDDVPALVDDLVRRHADDGVEVRVRRDVVHLLARRSWPGNVRELEGVVRLALARHRRGDVTVEDLPLEYRAPGAVDDLTAMQAVERDAIVRALDAEAGNKQAAAARLGISRSTLYRKLGRYHLG
jgi:sigma-54 dependent transcriptional regulator, acetoin dehydrogenase operon transcriptional activator AcoR